MTNIYKPESKDVFNWFEKISEIPRESKNEKQISDYIKEFCMARNLKCIQDEMYNLIIFKEAASGYENSEPIILQGHLDMVCEKSSDSQHDFKKDGIKVLIDGDFLTAEETTLGADNGIAVAMILALLDKKDYIGPGIEAVLTVDEEEGMGGAEAIDVSMLEGKRFINLDSEEGGIFYVSSAGGIIVTGNFHMEKVRFKGAKAEIKVGGLLSGHSGAEIDKERGNADKILGRVLYEIEKQIETRIIRINGGNADNVIPKESNAELIINEYKVQELKDIVARLNKTVKGEYRNSDRNIEITLLLGDKTVENAFNKEDSFKIISLINLLPYGVQNMSMDIAGLVETSVNLGIVKTEGSVITTVSSIRSSNETRYKYVASQIENLILALGGEVTVGGEYPAWEYNADSDLIGIMAKVYEELFEEKPEIAAIHAGLECSFFSKKIKEFDCVSIGPWMFDVHTIDERVSISSIERTWIYILALLENLNR